MNLIEETDKELNIKTNNFDINLNDNGLIIAVNKQENHTLEDLKQKLINYLYELEVYDVTDIEMLKILFKKKNR